MNKSDANISGAVNVKQLVSEIYGKLPSAEDFQKILPSKKDGLL